MKIKRIYIVLMFLIILVFVLSYVFYYSKSNSEKSQIIIDLATGWEMLNKLDVVRSNDPITICDEYKKDRNKANEIFKQKGIYQYVFSIARKEKQSTQQSLTTEKYTRGASFIKIFQPFVNTEIDNLLNQKKYKECTNLITAWSNILLMFNSGEQEPFRYSIAIYRDFYDALINSVIKANLPVSFLKDIAALSINSTEEIINQARTLRIESEKDIDILLGDIKLQTIGLMLNCYYIKNDSCPSKLTIAENDLNLKIAFSVKELAYYCVKNIMITQNPITKKVIIFKFNDYYKFIPGWVKVEKKNKMRDEYEFQINQAGLTLNVISYKNNKFESKIEHKIPVDEIEHFSFIDFQIKNSNNDSESSTFK